MAFCDALRKMPSCVTKEWLCLIKVEQRTGSNSPQSSRRISYG
jgi:hypothetical protein